MTSTVPSTQTKVGLAVSNLLTSAVRWLVPLVVGGLLNWPFSAALLHDLHVDSPTATRVLTTVFGLAFAYVYYLAVRALEEWKPSLGVLLGKPTKPAYDLDLNPVSMLDKLAAEFDIPDSADPFADSGTSDPNTTGAANPTADPVEQALADLGHANTSGAQAAADLRAAVAGAAQGNQELQATTDAVTAQVPPGEPPATAPAPAPSA